MKVNVLTYNMSWATQKNKALGSEKDFVEACQESYERGGKQCTDNAVKKIGKLRKLHLMGIQEVNSAIEKKIKMVQPNLKVHERAKIGQSIVSLMWDPKVFGKKKEKCSFNLVDNDDSRPCLIVLTKKDSDVFLLMNLHSPWETQTLPKMLSKRILKCEKKEIIDAFKNKDTKIIVTGDFNDDKALISKKKPLTIRLRKRRVSLTHNKTKKQLKKDLISCCWHEEGHRWAHFDAPGDYILTNDKVKQLSMSIPKIFNAKTRNKLLYSDHKPVLSVISF